MHLYRSFLRYAKADSSNLSGGIILFFLAFSFCVLFDLLLWTFEDRWMRLEGKIGTRRSTTLLAVSFSFYVSILSAEDLKV